MVRRARSLVCYWDGAQLVLCNYRTRAMIAANPVAVLVLGLLDQWSSPTRLQRLLPGFNPQAILRTMRTLTRHGAVVEKGSAAAAADEALHRAWASWFPQAAFFHFGTKDVPYEARPAALARLEKKLLEAGPNPAFFKSYAGCKRIALRRPQSQGEFVGVLTKRRTHREFSSAALPFETLCHLLFYTWGVTGSLDVKVFGKLPLKTSPSSGARHPVEAYVLAMRVEGLAPGLYHYNPKAHLLEKLKPVSDAPRRAVEYCAGQSWVKGAAAVFLMTAVFPRSMWKYPTARAYRTVLLDAGHVCQTFCLVATWLGLAPFCTMAMKDSVIEKDLGIDGVAESALYIAGVGMPTRRSADSKRRMRDFASL